MFKKKQFYKNNNVFRTSICKKCVKINNVCQSKTVIFKTYMGVIFIPPFLSNNITLQEGNTILIY